MPRTKKDGGILVFAPQSNRSVSPSRQQACSVKSYTCLTVAQFLIQVALDGLRVLYLEPDQAFLSLGCNFRPNPCQLSF